MNGIVKAIALAKVVRLKQRGLHIHIHNQHNEAVLMEPQTYLQGSVMAEPLRNVISVGGNITTRLVARSRESDRCAILAYRIVSQNAFVQIKCNADASLDQLSNIWLVIAWEILPSRGHRFALELVEASSEQEIQGIRLPYQSQLDQETIVVLLDYLRHGQVQKTPTALNEQGNAGSMYLPGQTLQRHCMLENSIPFVACATLKDGVEAVLDVRLMMHQVDGESGLLSPTLQMDQLFSYSPSAIQVIQPRPESDSSSKGKMTLGEALKHAVPQTRVDALSEQYTHMSHPQIIVQTSEDRRIR
jgi:hypothetical protein